MASGNRTVKLVPHKVQDTISVNNARRIIIQLSQPLTDIADLINDNINLLGRHNVTLSNENVSMTDLKKRMYVPVVSLRHKELEHPTTICTNAQCCEIYMVGDKKKYHYKQRCHDPCYLTNVPEELIGSPELLHCYAMLPTKKCRECGCEFSVHMHIYYLTETYEDKITDAGIQSQITDRESAVKATKKLIEEIESRKDEYEAEKEVIIKTMAKFAHFLQYNAIAPYNDAYKGYIEYLIDREKSHGKDADAQIINNYNNLLKRYHEEKEILEGALSMSNESTTSIVKSDDVFNAVQALFQLKNTGTKIKELYEKQTDPRKTEHDRNTEYVLDAAQVKPGKKKPNKRNTDGKGDELDEKEKLLQRFPDLEKYFLQREQIKSKEKEEEMAYLKTELLLSEIDEYFFLGRKFHDELPNEDDDATRYVQRSSGDKNEYKENFGGPSTRLSDPYDKYKDNFDDPHEPKGDGPYKNIAKLKGRREMLHKQKTQGADKNEYKETYDKYKDNIDDPHEPNGDGPYKNISKLKARREMLQKQEKQGGDKNEYKETYDKYKDNIDDPHEPNGDGPYKNIAKLKGRREMLHKLKTQGADKNEYKETYDKYKDNIDDPHEPNGDGPYKNISRLKGRREMLHKQEKQGGDKNEYKETYDKYKDNIDPHEPKGDGPYKNIAKLKGRREILHKQEKQGGDKNEYKETYDKYKDNFDDPHEPKGDGPYKNIAKLKGRREMLHKQEKQGGDKIEYKETYDKYKDNFDDPHEPKGDGPYKNIAKLKGRREMLHKQEMQDGDKDEYPGPSGGHKEPLDFYNCGTADNNKCGDYFHQAEGKRHEDNASPAGAHKQEKQGGDKNEYKETYDKYKDNFDDPHEPKGDGTKGIEEQFLYAAEYRDLETVKTFIRNGGNPNCHQTGRVTALHVASERGDIELGEILLSSGRLNFNCFTDHGHPPLIIACNSRQKEFVSFLLSNGANVDIADRFGKTALHHVVMADSLPVARVLMEFRANLEVLDTFHQTPLSAAVVQHSYLPMVEFLLESGADINVDRGKPVSHIFLEACLQCHTKKQLKVIQCLLQHGVDPNLQHHITYRNALHLVGRSGYLPLAKVLVEWGTDWDHTDRYMKTPLAIARVYENAGVANFFRHLADARR